MRIEPVCDEDTLELILLAQTWGQSRFAWSPGSAGVVARDADGIAGFALLHDRPYGHVVEELWCRRDRRGKLATAAIIEWVETQERHRGGHVGGIVAEGTPLYVVLRERGYEVTHHVLTKAVA